MNYNYNQQTIALPATATTWAHVILPLALPTTYTYAIPEHFSDLIKVGVRVEVNLGKKKKYAGIIKEITTQKPPYPTKEILNVLDEEPVLYPEQLKLWHWISNYYMCSEGEVMIAALPAHFKLSSETILLYNEENEYDFTDLNDDEYIVAEALSIKKEIKITEIQELLDVTHVYPVIKNLIDKNICRVWEQMTEKYKAKLENYVILHPTYHNEEALSEKLNDWKGAPKQMELLLAYLHLQKTQGEVIQSELLKKAGATPAQLKGLVQKDILLVEKRSVDRIKVLPKTVQLDFELSEAQNDAYQAIGDKLKEKNVCLLHGITSSGKTQIYIRLMETYFSAGKQVLYLLPEIALTTQIIRRLQKHFGGNIAIYHSKFNNNERVELWNKIKTGEVKMVVGARSALFLPFQQLGLVIVDEEHDGSYKQQEPAPRYNARDTAIFYASLFNAKVLLGSATPSVESYYNAYHHKYGLVELNDRFGGIQLPAIEIVDTRQMSKKEKVMLSPPLKDAIQNALDKNKQVILFQNRRGYNPYMICGTCGFIPQCIHCSVSLTLHKFSNRLHCHYCASTYPKLITCPGCGSNEWLEKNFGTEKIEELLDEEFPNHKVGRMDVDNVRGKTDHDNLIQAFEQHRLDILVGTQMVVKGLDFDNVSLVGILDADGLLSFADFRVNEKAYQLMEQVSGRAGRKGEQGKVMIQASNVQHPILQMLLQHDYKRFYEEEIAGRQQFFYPPFSRIILLTLRHKDKIRVTEAADHLAASLKQDLKNHIIGPADPVVNRVRNQYLKEILIKLPKEPGLLNRYKSAIHNHISLLHSEKKYRSVFVVADVDAV